MPTILEIIRDLLFGRFVERRHRREAIRKIKKIRYRALKFTTKHKKTRYVSGIKLKKTKKSRKPGKLFKKIEKLSRIQERKVEKPIQKVSIRRARRKVEKINAKELAEAFKLSASTIQEIYNKLKETEKKIPEQPTGNVNTTNLKTAVEEIEKTATTSGVTLVPEILDLISYTKERIRELDTSATPPKNPVEDIRNQVDELEREKKHLQEAQKVMEEKYYKREIDETSFKKVMDEYQQRVVETDIKLKNLKKDLEDLESGAELPQEKAKLPKIPEAVVLKTRKHTAELKILGIKLPKFLRELPLTPPEANRKEEPKAEPDKKIPTEIIKEVIAADIMTKNVYTIKPNDTLNYVVRLFAEKKISGAPVIRGNTLTGVIAESDIVKFIGEKEMLTSKSYGLKSLSEIKAEEVMQKTPHHVYEFTKLSEIADMMNKHDITRVPVLNDRRELVGILTRNDIMRVISKELLFKILEKREIERVMKVETDIDEILQAVERRGSIGLDDIKKRLLLPEDKIEEWGKILEKHNLIELFYPPIGKPEFRKKIK